MKRLMTGRATTVLTLLLLVLSAAHSASAQTPNEIPEVEQSNQESNWRTLLNLAPEQVREIRAIRRANRLEWQAARRRVREALGALDQAIYSDGASEAVIEQRSREVAEAQAAEVHLRAMTELSIRRVLTPEQLDTFRKVRNQHRLRAAEERRRRGAGANALDDSQRRPLLTPRRRRNVLRGRIRP